MRCPSPCYATAVHLPYFLSLTQQEEEEKQVLPMFAEQIILCTLIFIQCVRHEVEKKQEGSLMPQRSWMKLCLALHLSSQQGQHTVYLLAADLRCHWAPSVWMWFEVDKEQEPAWHSWLPQCLFCKLRGPSAFLIYSQHSWILQRDQEYTIIKYPLGCLAHRQRRMSWYCIVSLRKFYPPEQRDKAGLHRRHRQKEGGRQSTTEERQV